MEQSDNNTAACCEVVVFIKGTCGSVECCEMLNRATIILQLAVKLLCS